MENTHHEKLHEKYTSFKIHIMELHHENTHHGNSSWEINIIELCHEKYT